MPSSLILKHVLTTTGMLSWNLEILNSKTVMDLTSSDVAPQLLDFYLGIVLLDIFICQWHGGYIYSNKQPWALE